MEAYSEKLSSKRTSLLFAGLMALFFALMTWRRLDKEWDTLTVVFGCLGVVFLFYVLNFRTLEIRLAEAGLALRFGVFTWRTPWSKIAACALDDELNAVQRYGGAGIHFMMVKGRYRVNFNFLEYPRLVVRLREKQGAVWDVSFSTRQPDEVRGYIQVKIAGRAG